MSQFKYLGTTAINQNLIQEEIKRRLSSVNACYRSVQSLLSSHLMSKNLKMIIYKTMILSVILYGCETWSLTLREEHRLRVFENKVLRRIFGPKRDEVTGG
jgi:predicted ABC-class ATPase